MKAVLNTDLNPNDFELDTQKKLVVKRAKVAEVAQAVVNTEQPKIYVGSLGNSSTYYLAQDTNLRTRIYMTTRNGLGILHIDVKISKDITANNQSATLAVLPNDCPTFVNLTEDSLILDANNKGSVFVRQNDRTVNIQGTFKAGTRIIFNLMNFLNNP